MDTDKIIQDLNRRFAAPLADFYQRRIIFWYDEDTVQFFLIGFQLVEAVITFRLPLGKSFSNGRNFAKQWMVLKI